MIYLRTNLSKVYVAYTFKKGKNVKFEITASWVFDQIKQRAKHNSYYVLGITI